MVEEGKLVVEGSDDKLMGPFVEELSLLGTGLISGKTKMRRLGLKSGEPTAQQGDRYADIPSEGTTQLYPWGGRQQGGKSSPRFGGQRFS